MAWHGMAWCPPQARLRTTAGAPPTAEGFVNSDAAPPLPTVTTDDPEAPRHVAHRRRSRACMCRLGTRMHGRGMAGAARGQRWHALAPEARRGLESLFLEPLRLPSVVVRVRERCSRSGCRRPIAPRALQLPRPRK
jgi:hypothetical protein